VRRSVVVAVVSAVLVVVTGMGCTVPPEVPGLTNPAALTTYTGPSTISGGTVVIEDKRITSRLTVEGGNVTIRNCLFEFEDWYHLWARGGTVTVEHSEFDGLNTSTTGDDNGITGGNLTIRWSVFRNLVNGINLDGDNSLVEHNAIGHPNTAYGPAHSDGIEVYGGAHIVIRSNKIDIVGAIGETGAVNIATDFGNIDDVTVEDNDLTGGTATLYVRLQGQGESLTNVKVRNNRFHSPHIYFTHSVDPLSAITQWTGNTLDGAPLAL
jgi:hypothetical protein